MVALDEECLRSHSAGDDYCQICYVYSTRNLGPAECSSQSCLAKSVVLLTIPMSQITLLKEENLAVLYNQLL